MFPSYGASIVSGTQAVLNAFAKNSNPISSPKAEGSVKTDIRPSMNKAKPKEKSLASPVSPLSSSGVTPQGLSLHDGDDADMVFMSSAKHNENEVIRNRSDALFTDADFQDILRPRKDGELPNGKDGDRESLLVNGSVSPKRNSRTSRESTGSSCSESHLDFSRTNSSSSAWSPLPKLLEDLSPAERASMTRPQIVAEELLVTERIYVRDLQEVIEGYLIHLLHHGMTDVDIETIFGNLEDIYDFNKSILEELEKCQRDPVRLSQCFLDKAEGFNSLYVQYCTNYPESASFLMEILKDKEIAEFFLERQKAQGHTLPIDSYLMKPVQRIMKYHLLFKDIAKNFEESNPGYDVIQAAAATMTDVAEYINEMKRLLENALRVQQILGSIEDLEGLDVFATGRLVLENTFRLHGSRGDKQLYLFEKLLLICKKLDEGTYQFRDGISCSNMMLSESIPKEPLCFQLIRFDNQKVTYTMQAKNAEIKKEWTKQLKRLIIENHTAMIPPTARAAILGPDKNRVSKYNTIPLQALDEKIHWRRQKQSPHTGLENQQKERGSLLMNVKRESILKDEGNNTLKRSSLNQKAKEHLEKKDSKEKMKPWKLKRNKPRKNPLNTSFETEPPKRQVLSPNSDVFPPTTVVKSRSLESLRDALSSSQENLLDAAEQNQISKDDESKEAHEQIRRLSFLHDLISLKPDEDPGSPESKQIKTEQVDENTPQTPRNARDARRLHVSKSVYLDLPDDPLKPGDLRRSRPLSLPPDAAMKEQNSVDSLLSEEVKNAFKDSYETLPQRPVNDLRKYGLTRTRSFTRKSRGSSTSPAGSSNSIHTLLTDKNEKKPTAKELEDADDANMLEKRLSIISDDDKTSSSIKNTIRQVSQAFSSYGSEQTLDSNKSKSRSNSNLSVDLEAFLSQDSRTNPNMMLRSKRRSLGSIISETIDPNAHKSLDELKKRAYSTTVINEVSLDLTGDEFPAPESPTRKDENVEMDIAMSGTSVKDRITKYTSKLNNEDIKRDSSEASMIGRDSSEASMIGRDSSEASLIGRSRRNSELSEMSTDSQISDEGLHFDVRMGETKNIISNNVSLTKHGKSKITLSLTPRDNIKYDASKSIEDRESKSEEQYPKDDRKISLNSLSNIPESNHLAEGKKENDADLALPKRPAAPASLNYVRSFAASVRLYRKKNVKVTESKSVYDRIREYTALMNREKNEQVEKSVDEILESLDSVNRPLSKTYMDQRRKFANMTSISVDVEKRESVLSNPDVWFDTEGSAEIPVKDKTDVGLTANSDTSSETPSKVENLVTEGENSYKISKIRFTDLKKEKIKEENQQNLVTETLPRSFKTRNRKVSANRKKSSEKQPSVHVTSRNWRNQKSHTVDEGMLGHHELDRNDNIANVVQEDGVEIPEAKPEKGSVKKLVKDYYKCVIVPGIKEVEDMKDSNMRRSRKKKDREAAKSNLQRKLSLRNLDVEEQLDERKLTRSISCESVQRGTVKQLIGLFNVIK